MQAPMDLIFHGVGRSQIVLRDGTVIDIDKSQELSIQTTATEGKQQGGDGYYDLMTFVTEKSAKVSITDAVFNLPSISAATGTKISATADDFVVGEVQVVESGSCQLKALIGVDVSSIVARVVETGEVLKLDDGKGDPAGVAVVGEGKVGDAMVAAAKAGSFQATNTGAIIVDSSLDGKEIEFSYFREVEGQGAHMLEDDVPQICEFRHTHITDPQDDGNRYKVSIRAYKCKGTGSYTYEAKRGAAFSPKLEFSILNAGRADKKVLDYNVTVYEEEE